MANGETILRFEDIVFEYENGKRLLDEVNFSIKQGDRITLMGQNGAGKSTLFKILTKELQPKEGRVHLTPNDATIAIAKQTLSKDLLHLTVRQYFETAFSEIQYNLDKLIKDIFKVVGLDLDITLKLNQLSGGQQARLLLAHAIIQEPDILLLDEPTNNLDQTGIENLTGYLMMYEKTCIVISHDADFLNAFSDGVIYLDSHTKKIEQYSGNYFDVVEEIAKRIERENMQNSRMQSQIKEKRAQAEVFAHKGGKLRAVAKKMREAAEEAEESMVDVRKEDRTIRNFTIASQNFDPFFDGKILEIKNINSYINGQVNSKQLNFILRKGMHVLLAGPNGIGKSTTLEMIVQDNNSDTKIGNGVKVGYYKQDFSNLDYDKSAFDILSESMEEYDEQILRSAAAGFLLDGKLLNNKVNMLSEGQKGLLSFCKLTLMKPGLLILDEPTNHINFRHLPIIAEALAEYDGAMLLVSHIPDFIEKLNVDEVIDLSR